MKKRSAEILRRLVEAPSHRLRLSTLMDDYHLSEKTLRADIATAASFARDPRGASMVVLSSQHVSLAAGVDVDGLSELLDSMDLYDYRLSFEERRFFIACTLLTLPEDEWLSMQSLADAMYVTRNTVIADMKAVDEYLAGYEIPLVSKSKLGMKVVADQTSQRDLLIDLYATVLEERSVRRDFFSHLIGMLLGSSIALDDVVDAVRLFLRTHNIFLAVEVENEIVACLMVLTLAIDGRAGLCLREEEHLDQPLDTIGELVRFAIARLGLRALSNAEIIGVERTILARNLSPRITRFDNFDLYCVITRFLFLVGQGIGIDIQNDTLLIGSLLSHLKSVDNWNADAFEVTVTGPSGAMVDIVQGAAAPHFGVIEDYLHRSMDDAMRSSVVIHICAALYRAENDMRSCTVLIACPSSVATSKYLEAQVKNYFNFDIRDTVTTHALESGAIALDGIDFVISTVDVSISAVPVIVVSPVLSVEDINNIQARAFKLSHAEQRYDQGQSSIVSQIVELYEQGNPRKVAYLNRELSRVLKEVERVEIESQRHSPLLRMLDRRFVLVEQGPLDWKTGLQLASEGLLREGYFARSYVDKAIDNVEEYGSYIILNQGVALGHAGSQDGVFKDGLGLLVSREGITFDSGETVYLMFFFSSVSDGDYLDLFQEIISLGNDHEGLQRARAAKDDAEAYQVLIEMLTEYE